MVGPQRVEWRGRAPSAAVARLLWYVLAATAGGGVVWLLFGDEPARLSAGETNWLTAIMPATVVLGLLGAVPFAVAVLRRPAVAANYYAITVRPGHGRALILPWASLALVGAYKVGGEMYLFVRCREPFNGVGDRPGRFDRRVLRAARRCGDPPGIDEYHLAVCMADFVGSPRSLLTSLVAYAPDYLAVTSDLVHDH